MVSKLPCIEPENEKSIVITQEAPKFSYATVLAKTTSTSPSAIPAKKVVRVAPSDTESYPCTGPIIVVGPKEKVVCVRGLPKKLKAVELIQALNKFGPVKLDSLQIRKSDYGSCSAALSLERSSLESMWDLFHLGVRPHGMDQACIGAKEDKAPSLHLLCERLIYYVKTLGMFSLFKL